MVRLGTTVVRAVTSGRLRSILPVMRGSCTSAVAVFLRRTTTPGSTGSRCARFSNNVPSDDFTLGGNNVPSDDFTLGGNNVPSNAHSFINKSNYLIDNEGVTKNLAT